MSHKTWFVVQTKPRQEIMAIKNLQQQGYTAYCPQTVQAKRRRQCWQKVIEPLFPRYLFVQMKIGIDNFTPIRSTMGVVGLIRFGCQPAAMPSAVIEAIQFQEQVIRENCSEFPRWHKNDILEIIDGPFIGMKGIFQKMESNERVSLLLEILGQQNRISIKNSSLTPCI